MTTFDPTTAMTPANPQSPATAQPPQQLAPGVVMTDLQDESVRQYEFEIYQGRTGVTDRIYLFRPKNIIKTRRHFHDKLKFVMCNSVYQRQGNNEIMVQEAECCKKLEKASLVFAGLVIRYITNKDGSIIKPFQTPELRLWRFGVDKYMMLRSLDQDWKLENHDLKITCTDQGYQKLTITAYPEAVYKHQGFPPELTAQFEAWATAALLKIGHEMGKRLTDAEILKELGQATAAAPQMLATDQPLTDLQFGNMLQPTAGAPPAQQ